MYRDKIQDARVFTEDKIIPPMKVIINFFKRIFNKCLDVNWGNVNNSWFKIIIIPTTISIILYITARINSVNYLYKYAFLFLYPAIFTICAYILIFTIFFSIAILVYMWNNIVDIINEFK